MRSTFLFAGLVGLAAAAPRPQNFQDLPLADIADGYAEAMATTAALAPAVTETQATPTYNPAVAAKEAAADVTAEPMASGNDPGPVKRAACQIQPPGYGPSVTGSPSDFVKDPSLTTVALGAAAPTNTAYSQNFANLDGSMSQIGYIGLYTLKAYDTNLCAAKCDAVRQCMAFNIYFERDPALDPASTCPNPEPTTNIKCTLYGYPVVGSLATNKGQYRNQFQVVITGSNGYSKYITPPSVTNFTGPVAYDGAINAPLAADGSNTYLGTKSYYGPYDPSQCAAACQAQTAYDRATYDRATGKYMPCNFFNSYILLLNDKPQGTVCSFYSQTWDASYAVNYGYTNDKGKYTIKESFGYSLTNPDPGHI